MLTIRDQQVKSIADAAPGRPMVMPCQTTWIEVRLVDTSQRPIAGERYRIRLPDLSVREGSLDEKGTVRLEGIPAGQCQVCFPRIHGKEWRRL